MKRNSAKRRDYIPVTVPFSATPAGEPPGDQLRIVRFGIERLALVGDRGMITHKQIDALRPIDGIDWITALRSETIRKLVEAGAIGQSACWRHFWKRK